MDARRRDRQERAGAAPGVNPLFADVPTINWRMSWKGLDMLRGHREVFSWLKKLLEDREDAGKFAVLGINQDGEERTFDFHRLPQIPGSFFIVNLYVSRGSAPLPLVFSLHNLYLLGFQNDNLWHFFDDADLTGSGHHLEGNQRHWVHLGFSAGYCGNKFESVLVGTGELHCTYHILTHYPKYKSQGKLDEVEAGLFRFIVVLPETWRFPRWRACLYQIFAHSSRVLDRTPRVPDDGYEVLFKMWSKICKRLLAGPDEFHRSTMLVGFNAYAQLLPAVTIVLRDEESDDDS